MISTSRYARSTPTWLGRSAVVSAVIGGLLSPGVSTAASAVGAPTADGAGSRALPVYYLGGYLVGEEEPFRKPALYREWISRRVAENPDAWVRKSITAMFANAPVDPDYYGHWDDAARVRGVDVATETGVVTVDLGGIRRPSEPVDDGEATATLQQLVWTATAAASLGGASISEVHVLVRGIPVSRFWGTEVDQPLAREPFARSGVWILSPVEKERTESPVTVHGTAVFYENQGSWVLRRGGSIVGEGIVSAEACCEFTEYAIGLGTLEPGRYQIKVEDDGGTGFGALDTKAFRVR